jgi:hypothetical protein
VLALSGPVGEAFFCGPITDNSDAGDYRMTRSYLARAGFDLLRIEAEIGRLKLAADRLVRTESARIELIAAALLRHGTLDTEQIFELDLTSRQPTITFERVSNR